jgi:catechol 2,3-dioxygenase-like lactoylglutathione lyase family enzyme
MIDHINVRAQDFAKIVDFYRAALAPIGYRVLMEFPNVAGLGANGKPDLWISQSDKPVNPTHLALVGQRPQIHEFHAAALAAGGSDNGAPGLRADYHPNYYAAFVLDPEGNNIEVVCQFPDGIDPATVKAKAKPKAKARAKKLALKKPAAKTAAPAKKPAAKAKAPAKVTKPVAKGKKPAAKAKGKKRR